MEERETKARPTGRSIEKLFRNQQSHQQRVLFPGEDMSDFSYENDKIANHDGSWLSGVRGARFGLMMPGGGVAARPVPARDRAGSAAADRAEILSGTSETVKTPAGGIQNLL